MARESLWGYSLGEGPGITMAQGSRQHILEMGLQGGLGDLGLLILVLPAALSPVPPTSPSAVGPLVLLTHTHTSCWLIFNGTLVNN